MSTNWLLVILGMVIWVLLFWNVMQRATITELRQEIRRRREWQQRELDKHKERI